MNIESNIDTIEDERYFRLSEVELLGDPNNVERELGLKRKISFEELISFTSKYDLENDDFGSKE